MRISVGTRVTHAEHARNLSPAAPVSLFCHN